MVVVQKNGQKNFAKQSFGLSKRFKKNDLQFIYIFINFCLGLNFCEVEYSTSVYKDVMWNKRKRRWRAIVCCNLKKYEGGVYLNEVDAAKRVNQLCDELGIKRKNPTVDAEPAPEVIKAFLY
jgi:hypothetical protein